MIYIIGAIIFVLIAASLLIFDACDRRVDEEFYRTINGPNFTRRENKGKELANGQ